MKKGLFMPVPIPIPHALPRLAACATVAACPHGTAGLTARRIPGEMLADAIKPLNDRLRSTSMVTGWDQVSIDAEMQIRVPTEENGGKT